MINNFRHYGHPTLKEVNGLLNMVVLAFGFFNLILGAALLVQPTSSGDFFIVSGAYGYQLWGASFFLSGLLLLLAHLMNYWTMMRYVLLFLIFNKFVWLTALLTRLVTNEGSDPFLTLFFALSTVIQMGAYIYFPIFNKVSTWKES